jgi:hypothetical protein
MYIPMQREPIERSIVGCPSGDQRRTSGCTASGAIGGHGVEPSGWFDDVLGVVKTVGQVGGTVMPILGSLGI